MNRTIARNLLLIAVSVAFALYWLFVAPDAFDLIQLGGAIWILLGVRVWSELALGLPVWAIYAGKFENTPEKKGARMVMLAVSLALFGAGVYLLLI